MSYTNHATPTFSQLVSKYNFSNTRWIYDRRMNFGVRKNLLKITTHFVLGTG